MKRLLLSAIIFLILTSESIGIGSWSALPFMPAAGRTKAFSFNVNGLVYYGAGYGTDMFGMAIFYNDCWSYDPVSNIWTQRANYAGGALSGVYGFGIGNFGYAGGGRNFNNAILSTFYRYSPATNAWTSLVIPGAPAVDLPATIVLNGMAYLAGGGNVFGGTSSMVRFDPVASIFTALPNIGGASHPDPNLVVRTEAVGMALNGKCYVGTGNSYSGTVMNDWWEFDPATNLWAQKNNFPGGARRGAIAFGFPSNVGFLGFGSNPIPNTTYSDLWKYDPITDTWAADAPKSPITHASVTTIGTTAYMTGGYNGSSYVNSFVKFNDCLAPSPAIITAGGTTTICQGTTVTLTASSTPVVGTLSYQWYEFGNVIPGATAVTYDAATTATYTVKVSNSCATVTSIGENVFVIDPIQGWVTANGPAYLCPGQTLTLSANITGFPNAIQWFLNGFPISGANSSTYIANQPGIYSIFASDWCSSVISAGFDIQPGNSIQATISPGFSASYCTGSSVLLTGTIFPPGALYQWQLNGIAIPLANAATYSANAPGNYTLLGTNACASGSSFPTTVSEQTIIPTASISSGTTSICGSGSIVLLSYVTGTPVTYQWKRNGSFLGGATNSTYTATQTGSYSVMVVNACGNVTSNTISITQAVIPTATISSGATTVCTGGSTLLSSSVTGVPVTYQWQRNGTNIASASSATYAATLDGNYTLVATNACGNVTSNAIALTSITPPAPSITAAGPVSICTGGSVVLNSSVTGTAPISYQWQRNGVNISAATGVSYTATLSGTYRLQTTNSCGTVFSNTITVSIISTPTVTVTASGPISFCTGGNVVLTASGNGANPAYQWMRNGVNISGATNTNYTVTISGSYVVQMTNSCGNAISSATVVAVVTLPTASITATFPSICTGGSTLLASSVTQSPLTYQWKLNNANIIGATSATYTATVIGNYSVVVTNACGNASSNTLTITAGTTPTATISTSGATSFCSGGSVTLNSSVSGTPVTYQWKRNGTNISGATSANYTATLAGSYTLQITNNCGNVTSNAINVTLLTGAPATPGTITGPSSFCDYQTGVAYSIAPVANATSYNWTLPLNAVVATGQGTTSITVNFGNKNGKVKVQAINSCGSSSFQQKNVISLNCVARPTAVTPAGEIVSVFPSPAFDEIHIAINSEGSHRYNLTMMNITGKVVMNNSGSLMQDENELTVDVSSFVPGIYFLTVELDGERIVKKVVIE